MTAASPRLIFLYGPPAVGKLTVAKAISQRSEFRVLHNHLTIDPVAEVLVFGTPLFWETVGRFRADLLEAAAREGVDVVYTYVFAPGDEPHVDRAVGAYERAGGSVTFVQLVAPRDELMRRVEGADRRQHGKIKDAESLAGVLEKYDVFTTIPGRDSLVIDLVATSADEAAEQILSVAASRSQP